MKKSIIKFKSLILLAFLVFSANAFSQKTVFDQSDSAIVHRIKKDIYLLASDSLQGREAGTNGEIMARDYIVNCYKTMGIAPAFKDGSYLQAFSFKGVPKYGDSNFLKINKKVFKLGKDFYPLSYSTSSEIKGELLKVGYGIVLPQRGYNDYLNKGDVKGKIAVIETGIPKEYSTDSLFSKYLQLDKKIDTALAKGAIGVIFINSDRLSTDPPVYLDSRATPSSVPVIYAAQRAYKLIMDGTFNIADFKVDLVKESKTGYNVAAFIDNKAPTTIIIGGHYDHLGWGGESSFYHGNIPMIHNGADDNASGTTAVMELARYFNNSPKKNNNYLFINFSGEEKGLLGSSWFVKSDAYDLKKINYMVNFDMVGQYDSTKGLIVFGTGTSSLWDTLIGITPRQNIKIKKIKTGLEGSDQMSFYLKGLPVLFINTGPNAEVYHRPTDDADKLNYPGEALVVKLAERLIEKSDSLGKLPFVKSADSANTGKHTYKVTLGVVPDMAFEGKGMRIEAVKEGKTAYNAGLKAGDIVLKIGDNEVLEMKSYMKALGKYQKGDKAQVTFKRGEETLVKEVVF